MPNKTIAIEDGLYDITSKLKSYGYTVWNLNEDALNSIDILIVSGRNEVRLKISDTTKIINSRGRSSEEISNRIRYLPN